MARIRKPRTRTRSVYCKYDRFRGDGTRIPTIDGWDNVIDQLDDYTVRPGPLRRVKQYPAFSGKHRVFGSGSSAEIIYAGAYPSGPEFLSPAVTAYVWQPYVNKLNWKKLPTSNQADLLTNLAELDDTIAMFGKNLARSASYGGYKWGWAPLIGDIMACNDAANNVKNSYLDGSRRTSRYKTKFTISKNSNDVPVLGGIFFHQWEVEVKYSGEITIENDILSFYDYMGFHPSPKLIWDLVPLSFAIDYVLPIGDMLQQLTPSKGWVKSANFTGWRTITASVREVCKQPPSAYHGCTWTADMGTCTFVYRDFLSGVALEDKKIPRQLAAIKLPSIEQAFDLAYLSKTFFSGIKGKVSPNISLRR